MYTPPYKRQPTPKPEKPQRDVFDWASLGTAIVGVIVVVVATTLTQISQCSTDSQVSAMVTNTHDLAVATGHLADAAKAQADDMKALKDATVKFANAMGEQADNTASLVTLAQGANRSASNSADIAGKALALGQNNAVRQFRARIDVGNIRITNTAVGSVPHIAMDVVATGAAASNGAWLSGFGVAPPDSLPAPTTPCQKIERLPGITRWFFTNGVTLEKNTPGPLDQHTVDEIKAGRQALYFVARLCYLDGFNKFQYRDLCVFWTSDNWPNGEGTYCRTGNGAS